MISLVHATCVAINKQAILIRGPSRSGKSDLAFRLIQQKKAILVSDDQVQLHQKQGGITASPPLNIEGLLEIRGIGIVSQPYLKDIPLISIIDMVPYQKVERLPEITYEFLLNFKLPRYAVDPFTLSAVEKIEFICYSIQNQKNSPCLNTV